SAHPCPCGHATLVHTELGCNEGCDCTQSFRDLTGVGTITSLVVEGVQVYPKVEPGGRDAQVGGDHYQKHSIQPWDVWEEYGLNAFEGAVLKYLLRRKGSRVEDLKKARHTLDRLIEIEEAKEDRVLRPEGEEAE